MPSDSVLVGRFKTEFAAKIISTVSGALLILMLARLLDPEEYGLLYLAISFFTIAKLFSKLGAPVSAARYISEFKESDQSQVPHIIKFSLLIVLILTLIISVIIILGHGIFVDYFDEPGLAPFLIVGVLFLIFSTMAEYARHVLQGFEAIRSCAGIKIAKSTTTFVFAISLVLFGFGALGALLGYIFGAVVGSIVGMAFLYFGYYREIAAATVVEEGLKRRIAEYAVPLTLTNAANVLDKEIDTLLVGFFLNPVAVSFYVVSKQVVNFLEAPVSALGFTLAPSLAAEKTADNLDQAARIYEEAFSNTLLLYIPAAAGIVLVAEPLITLAFGQDYVDAVPVLQVLSIYIIVLASNLIASKTLDFLGRAKERAIAKIVTSVMNVGLNILLIPAIGVVGAAVATIITYSIYAFTNIVIIQYELGLNLQHLMKRIALTLLITAILSVVVFQLLGYITGWISLFAVVGVGVSIWAVCSILTGLLEPKQVTEMIS